MKPMDTPSKPGELHNPLWLDRLAWVLTIPLICAAGLGMALVVFMRFDWEIVAVGLPIILLPVMFLVATVSRDPGKVLVFGVAIAVVLLIGGATLVSGIVSAIKFAKSGPGTGPEIDGFFVGAVISLVWVLLGGPLVVGRMVAALPRFWWRTRACVVRRWVVLGCIVAFVGLLGPLVLVEAFGAHLHTVSFACDSGIVCQWIYLLCMPAAGLLIVALVCLRKAKGPIASEAPTICEE